MAQDWNIIGNVSSLVAAGAALATVWYARSTVREARDTRREERRGHVEALDEQRRSVKATLREQREFAKASASAHREQMTALEQTVQSEIELQRLNQVERIAEVVKELIDAARAEHLDPPPALDPQSPFRATRLPALLERLRVALGILQALGGPNLPVTEQLVGEAHNARFPMRIVSNGIDALREIRLVVANDERLVGTTGSRLPQEEKTWSAERATTVPDSSQRES